MLKGGYIYRAGTALAMLLSLGLTAAHAQDSDVTVLDPITVKSFEEAIRQSLGVSVIGGKELAKRPVANDISEVVRTMPGVNLTGNSPSGQRGNNRQIDIRGMGPENTLILIDGKPVLSRSSVGMGRGGERDTRGDSNWVPAELIERIEVLRGPAAARYGSGAAGGVVNIITKRPETESFSVNLRFTQPQNDLEGGSKRVNLMWLKPVNDQVTLRFTGNLGKSDADKPDINDAAACDASNVNCISPAGREGVNNQDFTAALDWQRDGQNKFMFDLGASRQRNIYAGDAQLGWGNTLTESLAGTETNRMTRATASAKHLGDYSWGTTESYLQFERTHNRRLQEGTAGGGEGAINTASGYNVTVLDVISAKSEADIPTSVFGKDASVTIGSEFRYEKLDLRGVNNMRSLSFSFGNTPAAPTDSDKVSKQATLAVYAEGNIQWNERLTLTPSLRLDVADSFGANMSGAINATYEVDSSWTLKGGIARAFKAPNLYQLSPTYVYVTNGYGCPYPFRGNGPCYVLGNADLKPETSWNKEIGVSYAGNNDLKATLTYFHNKYNNKIQTGLSQIGSAVRPDGRNVRVYQWENIPDSEVSGLEGSFQAPLNDRLSLAVNGTYMLTSKQRLDLKAGTNTGDSSNPIDYPARTVTVPLSLVPKYTINASLEWQATDKFTVIPSLTHFGKTDAPKFSATTGMAADAIDMEGRSAYTLINLSTRYDLTERLSLNAGVTNLLNKQIKRSGNGANTYNEPGRTYFLGLSATF